MNITTSYAEIMGYLRRLGELHPNIKQVIVGNSAQIISQDRSLLDYPVLWIETPEVNWSFDAHPHRHYELNFLVLYNSEVDVWQHEQNLLDRTLIITEDILVKMRQDAEENLLILKDARASSKPVLGYGHDNDFGWRTSLRVRAYMKSCAPDHVWQDACPLGALARFTWCNNSPGDFTDIAIMDASLPADTNWQTAWTWEVDNNGLTASVDPPPANLGPGSYLHVTLTITLEGCTLYASQLIYADQPAGQSVPLLIDKNLG